MCVCVMCVRCVYDVFRRVYDVLVFCVGCLRVCVSMCVLRTFGYSARGWWLLRGCRGSWTPLPSTRGHRACRVVHHCTVRVIYVIWEIGVIFLLRAWCLLGGSVFCNNRGRHTGRKGKHKLKYILTLSGYGGSDQTQN